MGATPLAPGTALPLSNTTSSSVVLGEALQKYHELHHHHASCCQSSPSTSPLPLLDQEGGDVPGLYVC